MRQAQKAGAEAGDIAAGIVYSIVKNVMERIVGRGHARSLGPALFAGGDALKYVWIFILAPLVGGWIAAIAWKILDKKD